MKRQNTSDWVDEDSKVGVRLYNHTNCMIDIFSIVNNTVGLDLVGDGDAFAYNNFRLNELKNNQSQIVIRNLNAGGYNNENTFQKGRFTVNSGINKEYLAMELLSKATALIIKT